MECGQPRFERVKRRYRQTLSRRDPSHSSPLHDDQSSMRNGSKCYQQINDSTIFPCLFLKTLSIAGNSHSCNHHKYIGGKYVCLPFMALFYPHESHDSATCCYKLPDKDSVLETLPPLEVTKKELKFKTHPDGTQSHSCWMNIYSNMMTIGFDPYPHCLSSDLPLKTTFPNQSWRFMGVSMVSTCFKMF